MISKPLVAQSPPCLFVRILHLINDCYGISLSETRNVYDIYSVHKRET